MGLFSFLWDSGKSVVRFLQRHKKKVIFTGLLAATYYVITRYAKIRQGNGQSANDELEKFRKKQHFSSNKKTCRSTFTGLLLTLKGRLFQEIDTEKLTAQLRQQPSDSLHVWERLKVLSFAKAVCSIYSSCLLYSMCSVVINILGGYMYVEKFLASDRKLSPVIHQKYLQTLEYVIGPGLAELSTVIEAAADKVVSEINLKEKLKLENIESLVTRIRNYVEVRRNGETETTRCLLQFMLSENDESGFVPSCNDDVIIEHSAQRDIHTEEKMLLETRDILESADFHSVLSTCLSRGFAFLIDNTVDFLPHRGDNDTNFYNIRESEIAMAKLIPIMNGVINRVMIDRLYDQLTADELVANFEANIYECFSAAPT